MQEINIKPMCELYEKDFALWLVETVKLLKNQNFQHLDLPHLIEEVASLAGRDRRELKSRLITLLEHALKRQYVPSFYAYRGWVETIAKEQDELKICLESSPSLQCYWLEVFDDCYRLVKRRLSVNSDYQNYKLPEICPFPSDPEQLLNDTFWE